MLFYRYPIQSPYMRILIIEDTEKLAGYMKEMLETEGFAVDMVHDGETGYARGLSGEYDLLVVDVMLPKKNGVELVKELRDHNIMTPIIMATAKDEIEEKVEGLDSGADDYLVKPFEMKEFIARVRALLRRPRLIVSERLSLNGITLDMDTHTVTKGNKEISLTLKEYAILEYLMRNQNRVISRDDLLAHCWDFAYDAMSNIVDVYIKKLREKMGDKDETYISTIRGVGYKFNA